MALVMNIDYYSTTLNFSVLSLVEVDHARDAIVSLLSERLSAHSARFWQFRSKFSVV